MLSQGTNPTNEKRDADQHEDMRPWVTVFSETNFVGFAICDQRLRFQAINSTLAAVNGLSVDAHLGNSLHDLLGDAAEAVTTGFRRVLAVGEAVAPFELVAKLPRRTEVGHWIESYVPIRSRHGKVIGVGAIVVEVTQQRKVAALFRRFLHGAPHFRPAEGRLLADDLRASVEGYNSTLTRSMTFLGQRMQAEPEKLPSVVAQLDRRLQRMQTLLCEVAARLPDESQF
ncbi:MAG: PAS domain-containing protein [Acidobacteriaceae bacterium]|nr:PAS domain-containing protein [Acidobacteriaceae bacterium]